MSLLSFGVLTFEYCWENGKVHPREERVRFVMFDLVEPFLGHRDICNVRIDHLHTF